MKTISIINLKGGVAKTTSAINIAHVLTAIHGKRVLLIDNDKQGNTSKFFNLHDYDTKGTADIMTEKDIDIKAIIRPTPYKRLDIITTNMNLLNANKAVLLDVTRPQQTRLAKALSAIGTS